VTAFGMPSEASLRLRTSSQFKYDPTFDQIDISMPTKGFDPALNTATSLLVPPVPPLGVPLPRARAVAAGGTDAAGDDELQPMIPSDYRFSSPVGMRWGWSVLVAWLAGGSPRRAGRASGYQSRPPKRRARLRLLVSSAPTVSLKGGAEHNGVIPPGRVRAGLWELLGTPVDDLSALPGISMVVLEG